MLYTVKFVLSSFLTLWQAWVAKTLWAWFVVTAFPSVPAITTVHAWGFIFTLSVLHGDYIFSGDALATATKSDEEVIGWWRVFMSALGPAFGLLLGFIAKQFL